MVQAAVVLDIHYTFVKYFSKAMATFSPNKKNTEKEMEKKMFARRLRWKKWLQKKISHTPLQRSNGPSLRIT